MVERKRTTEGIQDTFRFPHPRINMRPENAGLARRTEPKDAPDQEERGSQQPETQGVYVISVAARLLEMHPQTLRKYERLGLVRPSRTIGMLRLYSEEDIQQLRLIRHLEERLRLNLAGVEWALNLVSQLLDMHRRLSMVEEADRLRGTLRQEMSRLFQALGLPVEEPSPRRQGDEE